MFLASTILSILSGKLRGGTFSRLADANLKHVDLVFLALSLRVLLYSGLLKVSVEVGGVIHIVAFLVLALALYKNLHIRGMGTATAGTLMNTAVIVANGGRMPVLQQALEKAGVFEKSSSLLIPGKSLTHVLIGERTLFSFLGDVLWFRWPWMSGSAFSAGDVVLIAGVFLSIQTLMGVPSSSRRLG